MYAMAATLYLGFINVVVAQTRGHSPFPQMKNHPLDSPIKHQRTLARNRNVQELSPLHPIQDLKIWNIGFERQASNTPRFFLYLLYAFTMNNQVSALKEKSSIKEILKSQEFKQLMSKLEQYLNKTILMY